MVDRESKTDKQTSIPTASRKRKADAARSEPVWPIQRNLSHEDNMEQPPNNHEKSLVSFPIKAAEKTIFLKLKRLDTKTMCYRLSSDMPMHALLLDYCFRMGLVYQDTKFSYNNSCILETHTPEYLKMGVGPVHIIIVFSSREDSFIDMRVRRGLIDEQDPFMFLTVKPLGEKDDMCLYYKYSRFIPLRWMMLDYCKRKAFEAENVCFFYQSREEELIASSDKGVKNVIHVLPTLMYATTTPDDLQIKDYDDLSTVCYDMGVSRPRRGKETSIAKETSMTSMTVRLELLGETGETLYYKTSGSAPLGWIILHYCDHLGLSFRGMKFLYDGRPLCVDSTPEEHKMEEGGVIHVMRMLVGGGGV